MWNNHIMFCGLLSTTSAMTPSKWVSRTQTLKLGHHSQPTRAPPTTTPVPTTCATFQEKVVNGSVVDSGPFWFTCSNGRLVPSGCVDSSKLDHRVKFGETFDANGFEISCKAEKDLSNQRTEPTACLDNGQRYSLNETYQVGSFWYRCEIDSVFGGLEKAPIGCQNGEGKRVEMNQLINDGKFVYSCRKGANDNVEFVATACVKDGKSFSEGERTLSNKFYFTCQRWDGALSMRITGCLTEGSTGNQREAKIDESWTTGDAPFQFRTACKSSGDEASISIIQCHYKGPEGEIDVDPGCYKTLGAGAAVTVLCRQNSNGSLGLRALWKNTNASELENLKEC